MLFRSGGSIGGRIIRDKLFFNSSYHLLRHDRGNNNLLQVPTALERVGDFSQTLIRDNSGKPTAAQTFDPWNVTMINSNLYRRAAVPNAIIPNPHPAALLTFSKYPMPNRTPLDEYNAQNFEAYTVQTVRRHNLNNRLDYRLGMHSLYGSFGISYAEIATPRPFGESPFNGAPSSRKDDNPYIQFGDTMTVSPDRKSVV